MVYTYRYSGPIGGNKVKKNQIKLSFSENCDHIQSNVKKIKALQVTGLQNAYGLQNICLENSRFLCVK